MAENWDRTQAEQRQRIEPLLQKGDELVRAANEEMEKIYREHPSLGRPPSEAQKLAEQLRARADAIELAEVERMLSDNMHARIPALRRCEAVIIEKLR